MRRLMALTVGLMLALAPGTALAQSPDSRGNGFILRTRGDVVIAEGETVSSVVVIDGNLEVHGRVSNFVLVIEGDAVISGVVEGDMTVISGDIDLKAGAEVHNVNSVRGDVTRAQGATVSGDVHERDNFRFIWAVAGVFSILFWLGMTVATVAAALIFAAVGGRQLTAASRLMTGEAVNATIGTVVLWVGVPIVAVLAMITVIGLPLGLGLLLFLLPALGFLGFIVAGTRLGLAIVGLGGREVGQHPYMAAALGSLILQLLILLPFLGALIAIVGGIWGAGSLAFIAFRGAGGKGFEDATPVAAQPQVQGGTP
jgi:hypothetical protein